MFYAEGGGFRFRRSTAGEPCWRTRSSSVGELLMVEPTVKRATMLVQDKCKLHKEADGNLTSAGLITVGAA